MEYKSVTARQVGRSGGPVTWDDMQGSLSAAKLPPASAPAWTDITLAGFTTKALAFAIGDYIDIFVQTSHSAKLNQTIENHLHWLIETDDDGNEFKFTIDGVGAGIGGSFTAMTTITTGDVVLAGNAGKHNYTDIGEIDVLNTTVSSIYIIRLTRVAVADGVDTSELIYILWNDSHVKVDTLGSLEEESKI